MHQALLCILLEENHGDDIVYVYGMCECLQALSYVQMLEGGLLAPRLSGTEAANGFGTILNLTQGAIATRCFQRFDGMLSLHHKTSNHDSCLLPAGAKTSNGEAHEKQSKKKTSKKEKKRHKEKHKSKDRERPKSGVKSVEELRRERVEREAAEQKRQREVLLRAAREKRCECSCPTLPFAAWSSKS